MYTHVYTCMCVWSRIMQSRERGKPSTKYLLRITFWCQATFSSSQTYRDSRGVWCTALLSNGKTHSYNPDARVTYLESGQAVRWGGATSQEIASPSGHPGHWPSKILIPVSPCQPGHTAVWSDVQPQVELGLDSPSLVISRIPKSHAGLHTGWQTWSHAPSWRHMHQHDLMTTHCTFHADERQHASLQHGWASWCLTSPVPAARQRAPVPWSWLLFLWACMEHPLAQRRTAACNQTHLRCHVLRNMPGSPPRGWHTFHPYSVLA